MKVIAQSAIVREWGKPDDVIYHTKNTLVSFEVGGEEKPAGEEVCSLDELAFLLTNSIVHVLSLY